ncbi:DUF5594 family protein [Trinickia soli]|uniref:DUF5594 domain-containing protein n=1 Tax=Trinickia soli TaxID=380675 RepID=A0A2N7W0C0_9BURK|nr:DUF5594 family protein [Trinickia soli]KAA0089995.1 hypothetical protein CIW54_05155 [Paraburkholderia sp. T12-10]PMS22852.1 hypothetical protein C0Z19_16360 [Trinickia soli]CAB3683718.1 hypothetical protein LMG24076_02565 [Trinickia soli]
MNPITAHRFDEEFAPHIAQAVKAVVGPNADVQLQPYGGPGRPTTLKITAPSSERVRGTRHPLNLHLTWDECEIASLMAQHGPQRFAHYLDALPRKLRAWQLARDFDLGTRSQAEPVVLLGNLDLEG